MKILGALARLWPYAAAMLATLCACIIWAHLTIVPSGRLLLALVVVTFVIATWVTTPISLAFELSQTPDKSFWPWAPCVLVAAVAVAMIEVDASFSMLSATPVTRFNGLSPANFASGALFGFFAVVTMYPYLKLEMEPERATLFAAGVGFAAYAIGEILWIALAVAVLARWLYIAWLFYGGKRLARASCPRTTARIV